MKNYKIINNSLGWIVFLIAATVYLLTIEPTVSLWDCGEFISTSYKIEVGHPPGAPLFMIIARLFTLFAGHNVHKVAAMINSYSAIASGLTIMFLFWTITHIALKIVLVKYRDQKIGIDKENASISTLDTILVMGCGLIGALAYTFSDTFWFSAVESEVYASSSLFTALVFWAILKWENASEEKYANRWLIFIAYLMGLSLGVHLLNLLAIPAIVLVYYFRKYPVTTLGLFKALLIALLLLGGIMYMIIPLVVWLASRFELLFVNGFGLPLNSGVLFYFILLTLALAYGIWKSYEKKKVILNTILLSLTVILIGYSSFAMIVIRSIANTPIDMDDPSNVFSLLYYINREQYGDRPLITGQYFNAQPTGIEEGKVTYTPINGKYKVTNHKISYTYDKKFTTFFPRMWSSDNDHIDIYLEWGGLKESKLYEPKYDGQGNVMHDNTGKIMYDRSSPKSPPGFLNNLQFFFSYQVGHMYFRYFMWNFVGRQNDIQGEGDPLHGNWISGIKPIDEIFIGSENKLPYEARHIPSRNTYFFLPLLLGIFGMIFHINRDVKNFWVVMALFILTGIAIVIYLNQTPLQPRERDYAYAGSFYAFCIWIGLGVMAVYNLLGNKFQNKSTAILTTLVCLGFVPGIMAEENWNDHDRSGRYTARDIAYDYLMTCAPKAILFTNGDNDTYPLWYAQEVEGIRTDVRVVNTMLLNMDWYIDLMKRKAYDSDPLPISLTSDKYIMGTRDFIFVQEQTPDTINLKEIMEVLSSDLPQAKVESRSGEKFNFLPARNLCIPVDKKLVLSNGTVALKDSNKILSSINWRFNRGSLGKSELIIMDILANNNWKRPIYFAALGQEGSLGLEDFTQLEGFAYRLVPIKTPSINRMESGRVATDILYDNLMNKFKYGRMNQPDCYLDDFHLRTLSIVRLRSRFIQLADQLAMQGDTKKAIEVLDRCLELTPNNKVPYDYTIIQLAEVYYKCNEIKKANDLVQKMADMCSRNLDYYFDQKKGYLASISDDIRQNMYILKNLGDVSRDYNQNQLSAQIDSSFAKNYKTFTLKFGD